MDKKNNIQIKNYKEKIGSILQKRIDFNGNIIKKQILYEKIKNHKQNLQILEKIYKKKTLNILYNNLTLNSFCIVYSKEEINEAIKDININLYIILKYHINIIKRIQERILGYRIKNQHKIFNLITKKAPRVFQKDANTGKIIINNFYKFQLPGFPRILYKLRKKLNKRLLIQRIRRRNRLIFLHKNLALHTFPGTKEVSYASLIKQNNIYLVLNLYKYKLKLEAKKRTNVREKNFLQRPFKLLEMNQARFQIIQEPNYTTWYMKMQEQMSGPSEEFIKNSI